MADIDFGKELIQCENNIVNVFKKLGKIEATKGIESEEYKSMCRLLQDFLAEEEACVISIMQNPNLLNFYLMRLSEKQMLFIDEAIYSFMYDLDDSVLYRMNKLLSSCDSNTGRLSSEYILEAGIAEEVDIDFLNMISNPSIKYRLAYLNPSFSYDMAQNYFNSNLIYPELILADLKDDPLYDLKRTEFLLKRFCETFGTIALNLELLKDEHCYLLIAIKRLVPPELLRHELVKMSFQGVPFGKIHQLFRILEDKENEMCMKRLNNNKKPLTTE